MKKILSVSLSFMLCACGINQGQKTSVAGPNTAFNKMLDDYYNERMKLFPLEATQNGDNRYNDQLPADFTDSYRSMLKDSYDKYLTSVTSFKRDELDSNDAISFDIFKREMDIRLQELQFHSNYIPANQLWGLPLMMGQLGSGSGSQPFKTVNDYDNWLLRMRSFASWADSAIIYYRKGMASGFVLPKALVEKMVPQLQSMVTSEPAKSLFYTPIKGLPAAFSDSDKKRLNDAYSQAIETDIVPAYRKLAAFLSTEYISKARTTTGISAVPDGDKYYRYLIRFWTTTDKTPEQIYNTGLSEVKRIRDEMEKVKEQVGFKGDLAAFFEYMKTDRKFMPYKTPEEVLNAFRKIQHTIEPHLKKMFGRVPKTAFEIRQTEAFRAASASAEYNQGTADGSRPGIFYVPILDATRFNTTSGMESLFLHEAIPGHHYQISLQQENANLPTFRRFSWYGAYGEGWALYCESLGRELGLYTDPYQYIGALGDEIHRAIRLVVDVGMHTKGMTREEAIKYMMDNEPISEQGATAEIERYMAIPAQALSYKIGALKIRELRTKYEKQLGNKFSLSDFHDELLKDGCMPLDVLEKKMDAWAARY